jgi:hypothetical protein
VRKLVLLGAALPVSWWPYVVKAMCPNFGDHLASRVVILLFCRVALVALPISDRSERAGNALCGVGKARNIYDTGDSITPVRKGALLVCTSVLSSWMSPFSREGVRGESP